MGDEKMHIEKIMNVISQALEPCKANQDKQLGVLGI